MNKGLEALEKAKDIISDYSGAYMNLNVPESQIYGTKKGNEYKDYEEKDNELYKQLGVIETELKRLEKQGEILRIIISKRIDFDKLQRCANAYEYNTEVNIENSYEETTRQHITQEEYDTLEKMGLTY